MPTDLHWPNWTEIEGAPASSRGQERTHINPTGSCLQHVQATQLIAQILELYHLYTDCFTHLHPPPPILCPMSFAIFSCTLLNGQLLFPIPCHYSYITTHHIILHTSPRIIPCHITHLITSCHTIYFIIPTPTHCIHNH